MINEQLITIKDAMQLLGVSKKTLQRWDKSGKLIALRTEGNHRRYKKSDIEKMIGEVNSDKSDCNTVDVYVRKILKYRDWLINKTEEFQEKAIAPNTSSNGQHYDRGNASGLIQARTKLEELFSFWN